MSSGHPISTDRSGAETAVMFEMLTTFDEKAYEEGLREEGREEGRLEERANTEAERANTEKERECAERYKKLLLANGIDPDQ